MAEHEQGAERKWFVSGVAPFGVYRYGADFKIQYADADYLNTLEADLAALRQQLAAAEVKAALADEVFNKAYYTSDDVLYCRFCFVTGTKHTSWCQKPRYDALASPSRDTGSEAGHQRVYVGKGYLEETGYIDTENKGEE